MMAGGHHRRPSPPAITAGHHRRPSPPAITAGHHRRPSLPGLTWRAAFGLVAVWPDSRGWLPCGHQGRRDKRRGERGDGTEAERAAEARGRARGEADSRDARDHRYADGSTKLVEGVEDAGCDPGLAVADIRKRRCGGGNEGGAD